MKKLIPTNKTLFLNYIVDCKFGPQNCCESKAEIQIVLYKNTDGNVDIELEIVDETELKLFGVEKQLKGYDEHKTFKQSVKDLMNIDWSQNIEKCVDLVFTEKVKKDILKQYSKMLK